MRESIRLGQLRAFVQNQRSFGMRYRLVLPAMVLAFKDNHEAAVTMPEGTIFELNGSAPNDYRFVIVTFNGERVRMFASDLPDRAREIKARNGVPRTNRRTHRSAIYQSA